MSSPIDRESLRAWLQAASELERRLALERVVEMLPDGELERLLDGLVHIERHRLPAGAAPPTIRERVDAHIAATRRGAFRGEYELRNRHGAREPWQTHAWVAATSHLFDLAIELSRCEGESHEEAAACLLALVELAAEVDDRADELVVFEDSCARDELAHELDLARRALQARPPRP